MIQNMTYQVNINNVVSASAAGRVPGLVPEKTRLFRVKINSYDDEQVALSNVIQHTSTELQCMQKNNMFKRVRYSFSKNTWLECQSRANYRCRRDGGGIAK